MSDISIKQNVFFDYSKTKRKSVIDFHTKCNQKLFEEFSTFSFKYQIDFYGLAKHSIINYWKLKQRIDKKNKKFKLWRECQCEVFFNLFMDWSHVFIRTWKQKSLWKLKYPHIQSSLVYQLFIFLRATINWIFSPLFLATP